MFNKDGLINVNPSIHSPHQIISSLIKPHTEVLDVGCNTGMLGKILHKKNILDGLDINPQALKLAKPYYRHLFNIDLTTSKLSSLTKRYDYIILSDVLEHLPRPDQLLIKIKRFLKPNGFIICSLPNIARFEIRFQLLFGHFNYTESGIINQDHLRFFNKKSGQKLFEQTGYRVVRIIPTGLGHMLKIFSTLTAFQFIYLAKIKK